MLYGPLLDSLRGVRWPARRAVPGALAGTHQSRMRGTSPEFTEFRPYRQGDDPRRLDWKLLARSDRAYIRLATDRAVLGTILVVDTSASLGFPPATLGKWAQAKRLAVGLAAVAHADGDPVGLVAPRRDSPLLLAPRTRRGVVAELARLLDEVTPAGSPALAPALSSARSARRIAIISDFLGDADAALRAAREHIAAGGEVHAVHIVAREELEPADRAMLATDPEDPALRRPLVEQTRGAYVDAFGVWRDDLARAWRAAGADYTLVPDDEPAARAIRRVAAPSPLAVAR